MKRFFISGGSSGIPKNVVYRSLDWHQMIIDTAYVLQEYGLANNHVALIAQPSFPWDIGTVFAEASSMCGAQVICYGLMAVQSGMIKRWNEVNPDFIMAPSSLLMKLMETEGVFNKDTFLITAGEPLSVENEQRLREKWMPRDVRRIYGVSGLGTLGYQYKANSSSFCLNPRFRYFIISDENLHSEGTGRLMIQSKYDKSMVDTSDIVKISDPGDEAILWNGEKTMEILGRDGLSMLLGDGTYIHEKIVLTLKAEFLFIELQCEQIVEDAGEHLLFRAVVGDNPIKKRDFLRRLAELVPDLELEGHANPYGIHVDILASNISQLKTSSRGKLLNLVPDKSAYE